jgi:hypothetical protein
MSFTAVVPITPIGPYPATVGALALAALFVACDAVNGNSFTVTGHEILELRNTDTAAHTVTISSVPDSRNRPDDITAYSIPAGADAAFSFLAGEEGWMQSDGTVHFTANSALVFARVIIARR